MANEVKTTKIRIAGPAITNRRFTDYAAFKVDGIVATAGDNATPTKAQMEALVKAKYRWDRLCMFLGAASIEVINVLTDTSSMTTIPTSIEIEVQYRPSALAGLPTLIDAAKLGVVVGTKFTSDEVAAVGNIILSALGRAYEGSTELPQTFTGLCIETVDQPAKVDNSITKAYKVHQLTSKEYTLDGFVTKITVTEF